MATPFIADQAPQTLSQSKHYGVEVDLTQAPAPQIEDYLDKIKREQYNFFPKPCQNWRIFN